VTNGEGRLRHSLAVRRRHGSCRIERQVTELRSQALSATRRSSPSPACRPSRPARNASLNSIAGTGTARTAPTTCLMRPSRRTAHASPSENDQRWWPACAAHPTRPLRAEAPPRPEPGNRPSQPRTLPHWRMPLPFPKPGATLATPRPPPAATIGFCGTLTWTRRQLPWRPRASIRIFTAKNAPTQSPPTPWCERKHGAHAGW